MSYIRPDWFAANASFATSRPYESTTDATWESDGSLNQGFIFAQTPNPLTPLTASAEGNTYEPAFYRVPSLEVPIVLSLVYSAPNLSQDVILCDDEGGGDDYDENTSGAINVQFPALGLTFEVQAQGLTGVQGGILGGLTTPEISVSPSLSGDMLWDGTASATLPVADPVFASGDAQGELIFVGSDTQGTIPHFAPAISVAGGMSQLLELTDFYNGSVTEQYRVSPDKTAERLSAPYSQGAKAAIDINFKESKALKLNGDLTIPHAEMIRIRPGEWLRSAHGIRIRTGPEIPAAEAIRTRARFEQHHQHMLKRSSGNRVDHQESLKVNQSLTLSEQKARFIEKGLGIPNREGLPAGTRIYVREQQAIYPPPGFNDFRPEYTPPNLHEIFPWDCEWYYPRPLECLLYIGPDYMLQPPCETLPDQPEGPIVVPTKEVYSVINEVLLYELDWTPIPANGFNASIDYDSWTWSWSTRIPGSAMSQIQDPNGDRKELIVRINGESIRLMVEKVSRERSFGENWLRVSGRGRAAFLADPIAPKVEYTNPSDYTAQQVLDQAFRENGVSIGWSFDWQLEDWQIPAGIFSMSGTFMEIALRIAEAGGGYVQGHNTAQTLKFLPKYPYKPWEWDTQEPDIILPEDVVEVEGIEWTEKPEYNGVWVHGGDQGRADRILVGSSGGTLMAPTIVDELATDSAMTRQRGTALLGDTGRKANINLKVPVLAETGLIHPGTFIEYVYEGESKKGLVRSLSITHNYPQLWQTLEVETNG